MPSHHRGTEEEVRALSAFINLLRCVDSVHARLSFILKDAGLTSSQFGTLEALYHLGPLSQCEISRKILKTSGNITMVVDNLERRGLVRRERSADDRRMATVHLTDTGRSLIEETYPERMAAIVRDMSILTPEEQEELRRLCRVLGRHRRDEP